jgi:hypothetical protein
LKRIFAPWRSSFRKREVSSSSSSGDKLQVQDQKYLADAVDCRRVHKRAAEKDAAGIPLAKYAEMCTPQIPKLFFLSVENISFIMTQRQIKF